MPPPRQGKLVLRSLRTSPPQRILLSFALVILAGTLLLMVPQANTGTSPGFLRALFTATSATCVTGLVLSDTGTFWSLFGQVVYGARKAWKQLKREGVPVWQLFRATTSVEGVKLYTTINRALTTRSAEEYATVVGEVSPEQAGAELRAVHLPRPGQAAVRPRRLPGIGDAGR